MSTTATTSTARKIVGSLGVIGAAAAVAGMGTFGTFTDSATPVTATVTSGTVAIDVAGPAATVPVEATAFVPGDSVTGIVDLVNKGTADLGAVRLTTRATTSNVLTTNTSKGLQLTLQSCPEAWTSTKTCASGATVLHRGAFVGNWALSNPASLTAGGTDHLAFTISLPVEAGNEFQDLQTGLTLTFHATQRTGTAR